LIEGVKDRGIIKSIEEINLKNLGIDVNIHSYLILKGLRILSHRLYEEVELRKGAKDKGQKDGGDKRKVGRLKLELLREVSKKSKDVTLRVISDHISKLLEETKEALKANDYKVKECVIETTTRTIVGVGGPPGKIPFEVGISLDPLTGVPYIPGSTLKGAFRYALVELGHAGIAGECGEKLADKLFGCEESVGVVGVTDAYPVLDGYGGGVKRVLEPDVVTPHYTPGVLNELKVTPVPVQFLTIAPGVSFKFYIYYRREAVQHILQGDAAELLKRVDELQKVVNMLGCVDKAVFYALAKGVGARTSVGYSRFKLILYRDVDEWV